MSHREMDLAIARVKYDFPKFNLGTPTSTDENVTVWKDGEYKFVLEYCGKLVGGYLFWRTCKECPNGYRLSKFQVS